MGLINAGMMKLNSGPLQTDPVRPGMGMPMQPPMQPPMGMPPMQGGMPGAFSNNPAFLAQLQALMAGQGPGMSPPQFTPPMAPMTPPTQGGGRPGQGQGGFGGGPLGQAILNNVGRNNDISPFFRNRFNPG